MDKHTQEPWFHHSPSGSQHFAGGYISASESRCEPAIAHICGSDFEYEEYQANARRIVACVNACAGVDTDLLEGGELDRPTMLIMQENKEIKLLLGELLEFAQEVRRAGDARLASAATSAIAKAKGV